LALLLTLAVTAAACGGNAAPSDLDATGASSLPLADSGTADSASENGDGTNNQGGTDGTESGVVDPPASETSSEGESDNESGGGCLATSAPDGVNVSWWGLPGDGAGLDILGDGKVLMQTEAQVDGVVTLFGAPPEPGLEITLKTRTTDNTATFTCGTAGTLLNLPIPNCTIELVGGKPQLIVSYEDGSAGPLGRTVIRDGEPIDSNLAGGPNPIDTSAEPGSTYEYQIEMSDSSDRAPAVGECGSITVPELSDSAAELLAAKDLFGRTALGPHAYVTVSANGDETDLYLQALGPDGHAFVPQLDNPEFRNPFTIHNELLAAINAGQDVTYELDESSGLPTWWTVDDVTTKFVCFEVDTAPPELRVGPCDPQTDLIGR
jgi:hypothetical protein